MAGNFAHMALHGRHFLATAGITALVLALFPTLAAAEAEPVGDTGTDDVLVLGLTDSEGDPTTLVEEEAAAGAQLFRAQSSAVMTSALDVPEFSVAGVTWDGHDAPEGRIELRVRSADGWTEWQELEPEIGEEGEVAGTEPFIVGSGTGVQVRIGGGDGALPESLELHLIPPNPTDQDVRATDLEELGDLDVTTPEDDPTREAAPAPSDDEELLVETETDHSDELTDAEPEVPEQPPATPTGPGDSDGPGGVGPTLPTDDSSIENLETPSTPAPADTEPAIDGAPLSGGRGAFVTTAAMASAAPREVTSAAIVGPVLPTAPSRPQIISRAGWGAGDSRQIWNVPLRAAVVHHTAGTNSYTRSESAGIVRGIQRYHMGTRGWPDVGYNFLVDKYGQVFEGRRGSLSAPAGYMPEGAHARGYNAGTLGISVLGNYTSVRAPDIAIRRMEEVIAWKFHAAQIDMNTPSGFTSPGTAARPRGQNLPRIFAHRDVDSTTCPGNNIYARIPAMNTRVKTLIGPLGDGYWYFLNNTLSGGNADIEFTYGRPYDEIFVGDWNGDGKDTLAVRRGNRFFIRNSLTDGDADVEFTYGRSNDDILVGDWNGNGKDTLAVRRGNRFFIRNSLTDGNAHVELTYGRASDQVFVGDWNGNGRDTLAVRRGNQYFLRNTMSTGIADAVFTFGRRGDQVLVGDWNGNGRDTLGVRRGQTYFIQNTLRGGYAELQFTFGRPDDVTLVGDWNGNGRDTLGTRRGGIPPRP